MEEEGSSSKQQELRQTYSFIGEEDFVGLASDVDMLVQHLVNEDDEHGYYRVNSISGMVRGRGGGLGKTTIAGKVYNHPNVKHHFDGFAWICVSNNGKQRIFCEGTLQRPATKECLIALDDIWGTDAWECIKQGFPTRQKGSKILLTIRNREVALHTGPNGFHPRLLNENESWVMMVRVAKIESSLKKHEDINQMEQLGKKMVEQCRGVYIYNQTDWTQNRPKTRPKIKQTRHLNKNIKAILGKGESIGQHQGEVQKIPAFSYNELPYQLKPCFLYLSYFSEDTDIKAETLYQMWIAAGMLLMEDRLGEESMMDLAERYLRALAEREEESFLRIINYSSKREVHDSEESFLRIINYSSKREVHDSDDHSDPFTTSSSDHKTHRLVRNEKNSLHQNSFSE
ncbi:unnamed protein product [Coffea canephora]|uniref:NB-ARC domain-containing protein n=1 Tax=Coffea canephora TaxID=49390 RepID=A0A068TTJ6_COFCA|nr:unnamed protein product [Coffea canephora]